MKRASVILLSLIYCFSSYADSTDYGYSTDGRCMAQEGFFTSQFCHDNPNYDNRAELTIHNPNPNFKYDPPRPTVCKSESSPIFANCINPNILLVKFGWNSNYVIVDGYWRYETSDQYTRFYMKDGILYFERQDSKNVLLNRWTYSLSPDKQELTFTNGGGTRDYYSVTKTYRVTQ
jgi:hypothetical protein